MKIKVETSLHDIFQAVRDHADDVAMNHASNVRVGMEEEIKALRKEIEGLKFSRAVAEDNHKSQLASFQAVVDQKEADFQAIKKDLLEKCGEAEALKNKLAKVESQNTEQLKKDLENMSKRLKQIEPVYKAAKEFKTRQWYAVVRQDLGAFGQYLWDALVEAEKPLEAPK